MGRSTFVLTLLLLGFSGSQAWSLALLDEPRPVEVTGFAENLAVMRLEAGAPGQFPAARLHADFLGELSDALRLVVEANALVGGTVRGPTGPGLLDLGRAFQNQMPTLAFPQTYLEFSRQALGLRVGLQKFSWGRLDADQPADLLNPESYLDPIIEDEDERKIGVPAVSFDLSLDDRRWSRVVEDLRLTLVWVVAHPSFRFPRHEERWYPPVGRPPRQAGALFWFLREHNASPPRGLDQGNLALRVGGVSSGLDWAMYFYDGFDPAENFAITNSVKDAGALEAFVDVIPDYRRIRAFGADWAYVLGGATVRGEAMYFSRRGYPMAVKAVVEKLGRGADDFLERFIRGEVVSVFPRRDSLEWGLGVDYERARVWALLQLNQIVLLDNDTPLLLKNVDSTLLGVARRAFHRDLVEVELVGLYSIESPAFMVKPAVAYWASRSLELRGGLLLIGGGRRTLLGQFTHNDEIYVGFRYHF